MAHTKFFCFGPLRVEQEDRDVEIGLNKAKALLAYLVVTRQAHSRDALIALLWPELDASRARANLRRTLHRLAQALGGELFQSTNDTIQISTDADIWLDVAAFEQALRATSAGPSAPTQPDMASLQQAVDLYQADFLAGFTLPDSPGFDEWQFFQREQIRQDLAHALTLLASTSRQLGDWEKAILYARRWLALDNLHEPAHRQLMQFYAQAGQYAAALRQYDECVRILDQELGVTPEGETTELYELIRTRQLTPISPPDLPAPMQRPPQAPRARSSAPDLPFQTTPFIGRTQELDLLADLLTDPSIPLVTLIGPGGIGKTRLALAGAERVRPAFADGVYFISLAALSTAEQIAPEIIEQIGSPFYGDGDAATQLIEFLRDKHMLLVLDNFEHLMAGAAWLAEILPRAPKVKLLITSRERLNQSGETILPLEGLSYPQRITPETEIETDIDAHPEADTPRGSIMVYDAVQLFVQRVRLVRAGLQLQPADIHHIVQICRLVQGMPLALALAAGWAELLSFAEIAHEIEQDIDFLENEVGDLPARQRSVRAAFAYSWQRLPPAEQKVFRQLSIFRDGFTRAAAMTVAGADLRTLRSLSHKSFLMVTQNGRYAIHELLRQFGLEQLDIMGETDHVRAAHSRYYLAVVAAAESDLKGNRSVEALQMITGDFENVHVAWQWAAQRPDLGGIDPALDVLYLYMHFSGRFMEGVKLLTPVSAPVATSPGASTQRTWARLLVRRSVLRAYIRQHDQTIPAELEICRDLAQTLDDEAELAFCLLAYGYYYSYSQGDFATAQDYYRQSLNRYQTIGDRFYTARALHRIGYCYANLNDLQAAAHHTRQSLAVLSEIGNKVELAGVWGNLASFAFALGDYAGAERYSQEAATVGTEVGDLARIEQGKMQLGLAHFFRGDIAQAGILAEESLALARRIEFPAMKAYDLALLGLVASLQDDYRRGRAWCDASLQLPSTAFAGVLGYWGLAVACCGLGELDAARRALQDAVALALRHSYDAMLTWLLPVVGLILAASDQPQRAVACLSLHQAHPLSPVGWTGKWTLLATAYDDLKNRLGQPLYDQAWAQGQHLDLHEAIRYIADDNDPPSQNDED